MESSKALPPFETSLVVDPLAHNDGRYFAAIVTPLDMEGYRRIASEQEGGVIKAERETPPCKFEILEIRWDPRRTDDFETREFASRGNLFCYPVRVDGDRLPHLGSGKTRNLPIDNPDVTFHATREAAGAHMRSVAQEQIAAVKSSADKEGPEFDLPEKLLAGKIQSAIEKFEQREQLLDKADLFLSGMKTKGREVSAFYFAGPKLYVHGEPIHAIDRDHAFIRAAKLIPNFKAEDWGFYDVDPATKHTFVREFGTNADAKGFVQDIETYLNAEREWEHSTGAVDAKATAEAMRLGAQRRAAGRSR